MSSLWFFIKQLSTYRRQLLIGFLLSLALAASSIALLALSGWFISAAAFAGISLIAAASFNYFIPAAMIRLLAFIRILSRYADRVINHDFTFKILTQLRVWFYNKLIPLAPACLLSRQSGDLLNGIVNDIDTLDHLYLNTLSPLCVALFIATTLSLFIAYFSIDLAILIFTLICVSLVIISIIILKQSKKIGFDIQEALAQLRIQTIDFLQGFVDILLFVKKENRLSNLFISHDKLMRAQEKFAYLKGFAAGSVQFISGLTVWLVLIMGIPLVRNNTIDGAELAMIVLLIIAAYEQLMSLPFAFLSLGKTLRAAERILEMTHEKPAVIFSDRTNSINTYDIVFKNITFFYPERKKPVLKNFDLCIPTGTHLGIMGRSGSGKTTLAHLLTRIWDPASGEITLNGINLKNFSESELRKMITLVTQHTHIFNASVRDNITLMDNTIPDDAIFAVLKKVDLALHVHSLPQGLNTLMGEFGKNFSGGQIRRISIARALLKNTPILILDEPSAGLDDALMQRIWKNCENDFQNKTMIVITHDEKLLAMMHWTYFVRAITA